MRRKLFYSAVMASAVGFSTAWADDDAKEAKKDVTVTTVVVNAGDDPVVVKGQKIDGEKLVVGQYWLGVGLKSIEGDLAEFLGGDHGVLIEEVHDGSPASKAGVKKGDVILAIDSAEMKGVEDLLGVMRAVKGDKTLTLKIRRKSEDLDIKVTPEPRPVEIAMGIDLKKAIEDENGHGFQFQVDPEKMKVLRLGSPAGVITHTGTALKGDLKLHIVNKQDGKSLEMKIEREGDKPAVITITKDGQTKTYNESQIDELPEEVKATVQSMLKPGGQAIIGVHGLSMPSIKVEGLDKLNHLKDMKSHFEKLSKDGHFEEAQKAFEKAMAEMAVSADHAKAAAEALNSPEFRKQLESLRAEVTAKASVLADKAVAESKRAAAEAKADAVQAVKRAKGDKSEVEELRLMVEQLKKEIAELKAAAKDGK